MNKQLVVTQSNQIVNAAYKLTLNEQRAMLLILSKIDSKNSDYTHKSEFTITAKEFAQTFGTPLKSTYLYLVDIGDHLMKRQLVLPIDGKKHYIRTNWVSDVEYNEGKGSITINLARKMIPLLTQLKANFTSYHLVHTAKFKHSYSHRIYQLLIQWKSVGKVKVDLEGFKQRLMLPSSYDEYKLLKAKILIPALKEINKHSDLAVELSQIKEARKVIALEFVFRFKSTTRRIPVKHSKSAQVTSKKQNNKSYSPDSENNSLANSDINNSLKKIREDSFKDLIQ